jgi:hypothetical protein
VQHVVVEELALDLAMGAIAKEFRQKGQAIKEKLSALSQADLAALRDRVASGACVTHGVDGQGSWMQTHPGWACVRVGPSKWKSTGSSSSWTPRGSRSNRSKSRATVRTHRSAPLGLRRQP